MEFPLSLFFVQKYKNFSIFFHKNKVCDLQAIESSVRKEYPLGRVFYDDDPRMEGATNCGMLDMGEYLYDGKIVHFFTNDYRDFAAVLFKYNYSYTNLTKDIKAREIGACLYRFPYGNRNMYVYIQQGKYVNYLFLLSFHVG